MNAFWEFVFSIGMFVIDRVVKDIAQKAKMRASFESFIANRQKRANQTVETKQNIDEQDAGLDAKKKEMEKQNANPKT